MKNSEKTPQISLGFFKEIIEEYVETFSTKNSVSAGYAFGMWYFQLLYGFTRKDSEEILTEGSGDNNIDAIYYDKNSKICTFFQFKNPKISKSIKLNDVSSFIAGINEIRGYMINNKATKKFFNEKLVDKLDEIRTLAEDNQINQYRLKIVLGSDTIMNDEAKERLESFMKDWRKAGAPVEFEFENLTGLLLRYQGTIFGNPVTTINLKLHGEPRVIFERAKDPRLRIISGVVSGKDVAQEYLEHREYLLMKNVRVGLHDSAVNQDIYLTSTSSEAKHFLYFNNGITFVTDRFEANFNNIKLSNPQIVNGGQTVRILASALSNAAIKDEVLVQARFIELQDLNIAVKVTQKLNNQNPIKFTDIMGSSSYALLLKKAIDAHGYYLERRTDEYNQLSEIQKEEIAVQMKCSTEDVRSKVISLWKSVCIWIICSDYKWIASKVKTKIKAKSIAKRLNNIELDSIFVRIKPKTLIKLYFQFYVLEREIIRYRGNFTSLKDNSNRGKVMIQKLSLEEKLVKNFVSKSARITNFQLVGLFFETFISLYNIPFDDFINQVVDYDTLLENFFRMLIEVQDSKYNFTSSKNDFHKSLYFSSQENCIPLIEWASSNWEIPPLNEISC